MKDDVSSGLQLNRRRWMKISTALAAAASVPSLLYGQSAGESGCAPPIPHNSMPSNGGTCPFPIPWLDKNGNHNQMPKPDAELSNIYHFSGKLARCAGFAGMGTDNAGNRLAWGSPTTDFSYMSGEYWASRKAQPGTFAHI